MNRRLVAAASALLVPLLAAGPASGGLDTHLGADRDGSTTTAAVGSKPGDRYSATIRVTEHGIPHVVARNWGSLGYGSGYAVADAAICNLADTVLTARGQRSRYLGSDGRYDDRVSMNGTNLQVDALVTDMRNRRVVQRLLRSDAGPTDRAKKMVRGYVAGINQWLRDNEITDPACRDAAYIKPDATPLDLWYGVYLANVLASTGVFVKEIVEAELDDTGLPLPALPKNPTPSDLTPEQRQAIRALRPAADFGSNATAIGGDASSTGRGMVLGNPHFPWAGRYRFTQQHLTIPGKYDVAGASLVGAPVVNIGWNEDVAWSHTVSTAYRFTPYEYLSVAGVLSQPEKRVVEVDVLREDGSVGTVTEDLYRTDQGYVIDSPEQLMGWTPLSYWAIRDANAEHLRTIDTFLSMGGATDVEDLLRRQDEGGGMPWVNTTAADRHGDVLYADHSVVPHVTDEMASTCMTVVGRLINQVAGLPGLNGNLADGPCAWGADEDAQRPGILGPQHLPDVVRRDWVMNANDSFWTPNDQVRLEGYPGIIGCEECERTMRTRMVMQYVVDRLAEHGQETPRSLRGHQHENRVRAAEVMREDGALDEVCARTGETEACAVLAAWDGHSDADSVGTHIFEEFVERVPGPTSLWSVQFDPADPLNTPRGLRVDGPGVVEAMAAAIQAVREAGVEFDAPWGTLQVAGDRGAPPLPIGGGNGDAAGNANAVASRSPLSNPDRFKPISYGSSHIQAIAYLASGRVQARTILTYGQHEDPSSPWSSSQTELFSQEKWVRFPFTSRQVAKQLVDTIRISGR
ncbi:MAG TPA: penicillin acylase family protein [Nocardioides sp.]|nr:penicillin acylase family protein [Nocardioides sp.]